MEIFRDFSVRAFVMFVTCQAGLPSKIRLTDAWAPVLGPIFKKRIFERSKYVAVAVSLRRHLRKV